jgi:microcystin degradation protein MlrC
MVNERTAVPAAVAEALRASAGERLILLSDTGDSVYGGAPGDSTVILRELLEQHAGGTGSGLILLPVVDAAVVSAAVRAWNGRVSGAASAVLGEGIRLGGKVDSVFSSPVDVSGATVEAVWRGTPANVAEIRHAVLPECALLAIGRLRIVVMAEPAGGVNHPTLYESLGIVVSDAVAVVLKTASNFQYFDAWTPRVVRVDAAGMTQSDLTAFDWVRAPRPIFPLDADARYSRQR